MQTLEIFHSLISQGENALLVSYFKVFELCVDIREFCTGSRSV